MISTTVELTLTAILIGAIGIFSPTRFAFSVVMLSSSSKPWGRAVAYALGSTTVFALAALIGLLGVQAPGAEGVESTVNVVLGMVMIATAVAMLVMRRRGRTLSLAPTGHPHMAAAGLGAGVSIQSFGRLLILLAGGYRLGAISGAPIPALAATGLMILVWQAPIWGPMLLFIFRRERFDALERRARPAIERMEDSVYGALAVGAVGIWLLIGGLAG